MDRWPRRERFRAHLDHYKKIHGLTSREVAERLGLKTTTLTQYLYQKTTRPSIKVLQQAASLFECSILEFLDDPASAAGRLSLPEQDDRSRFFANLILNGLKAEDLTDEDRQILFEDFQRGLERLRAIKAHAARSVKPANRQDPA